MEALHLSTVVKNVKKAREEFLDIYKKALVESLQKATNFTGLIPISKEHNTSLGENNYWFLEAINEYCTELEEGSKGIHLSVSIVRNGLGEKVLQWDLEEYA